MTGQTRDEEDNATNIAERRNKLISYTGDPQMTGKPGMKTPTQQTAEWRKKLISYTGDPRWRDKPVMKKTTQQTGQHWGIRSSAISATPDDGTSQGWRRQRNEQGWMEEEANQLYRWPQMTGQARDEEDNATNRAERRKKLIAIPVTPDDGTSQGWRRQRNKQGRTEEEANQLYRWPQMTGQARDEEDNATNRAERRKKLISYTGDPRWRDKPGMKKTTQQTGQNGGRS